jgi:serine/threonine-protein kinase
VQQLGEGGMGVVFQARRTVIDKRVAMKVLHAELLHNPEVTERFITEARAASSIGSPHIIDVIDFGKLPDGATYFVMEYLDGLTLDALVERDGALAPERVVRLAKQIAEGLGAAHDADIVHRDLKPDNIVVVERRREEFVKILDFGI